MLLVLSRGGSNVLDFKVFTQSIYVKYQVTDKASALGEQSKCEWYLFPLKSMSMFGIWTPKALIQFYEF